MLKLISPFLLWFVFIACITSQLSYADCKCHFVYFFGQYFCILMCSSDSDMYIRHPLSVFYAAVAVFISPLTVSM